MEIISDTLWVAQERNAPANSAAPAQLGSTIGTPSGTEVWAKKPRRPGRPKSDPLAQSVRFEVFRLEDLENSLREYLRDPVAPAEHATLEFIFPVSSAFMVYDKSAPQVAQNFYGTLNKTAISVMEALAPTLDPRDQLNKQRSIAKICVEAIQRADGFRYTFHNNWISKEDGASRFSYYCNDSPLNKGRAVNEGAGTQGKKVRKPVYECQGVLAVKFSATKANLQVLYRHIPLHPTYEERAPPPRHDSKRRKLLELFDPENPALRKPREKRAQVSKPGTPPVPKQKKPVDPTKTRRRRASENGPTTGSHGAVDLTDDDGLRLKHDSLDNEVQAQPASESTDGFHPLPFPAEKVSELRGGRPLEQVDDGLRLPGMMEGSLDDGALVWGSGAKRTDARTGRMPKDGDAVAAARSTPQATAGSPTSELELLKAKLVEAEQRIRRLEQEKSTPKFPPPLPPMQGQPPRYPSYHSLPHKNQSDPPPPLQGPKAVQPIRFQAYIPHSNAG